MDHWEIIAALLMLLSVAISLYTILLHLFNYNKPYLQRYIIRILLMVPIYSINAWVAMMVPSISLYLDSSREIYESFVIYSFMKYLLNFLYYDTNLQQYIDHKPAPKHVFPFCFLPTCTGGKNFLANCRDGILQYVVIRIISTFLALISQFFGFYGEANYNLLSGYTYPILLLVNNASQIMAMYALVIFYTGYRQELYPMSPLAKFISIKLVIFFSFFQSVMISGLLELDFVEATLSTVFPEQTSKLGIAKKLQEFLICIDMLIAAVGHMFAFSHKPYVDDTEHSDTNLILSAEQSDKEIPTCWRAMFNLLDFKDERSDMSEHFSQTFSRFKRLFTGLKPLPVVIPAGSSSQAARDPQASSNSTPPKTYTANTTTEPILDSTSQQVSSAINGKEVINYNSVD